MSILSRIRSFFRPEPPTTPSPPVLRNKPGGMAYIKGITVVPELNGRIDIRPGACHAHIKSRGPF